MELLILSGILLFTGLLFLLNGRQVRRNILFSVYIPESEMNNVVIKKIKTKYMKMIITLSLIVSFVFVMSSIFFKTSTSMMLFVLLLHVLLISAVFIYKNSHDYLKSVKIKEDWMKNVKVVKATDTSLMKDSSPLPNIIFIMQILAFVVAFIFVAFNYDKIPDSIATHWNIEGKADAFSDKSFLSVYGIGLIGVLLILMLWASSKGISFFDSTLNPAAKQASMKFIKKTKLINSMMIHIISFTMTVIFILILIRPVVYKGNYLPHGIILLLIGILLIVTASCFYLQVSEDKKYRHVMADSDKAPYYNEDHYIFGLFYYNSADKNVWVPKLSEIGMTLNMARPMAWFISFMIIGLPVLMMVMIVIFS